jgi:hypothetical protein
MTPYSDLKCRRDFARESLSLQSPQAARTNALGLRSVQPQTEFDQRHAATAGRYGWKIAFNSNAGQA